MRKNLLLTTIIILIVNFVSAQPTRFGIYAGPVAATMFQNVGGEKRSHDYVLGASIGMLLDVPMQKKGSFQPGLNYIGKNSKDSYISGGKTVNTRTLLNYVEMPLNVIFTLPTGSSKSKFSLGGGIAAAIALNGQMTIEDGISPSHKIDLQLGDAALDDFGKYDFGINALAVYESANGFFISLNYNYGINRQFVGGDPKDKLYNRYFALRMGFLMWGNGMKK